MRRQRWMTEHDQRRWLARNVRMRRRALGMSMRAASARGGMHLRQWQKIEGENANVTIDTLAKVAAALDIDIVALLREPAAPAP